MPWMEKSVREQREEFVRLAGVGQTNISELSRRFGISRKTAYKWLGRFDAEAPDSGLGERSRRPHSSPGCSPPGVELQVLGVRAQHPAWGARKIARVLQVEQAMQVASSTVNSILKRNGCITQQASEAATPWQRFEHEEPNDLWQIDFKGHFALDAGRCHAFTAIDDHSRYSLSLQALAQETRTGVQSALIAAFERYGLPRRINADNGPPWGNRVGQGERRALTQLGVWLIRLGVELSHSRALHPQTNGKDERFHRTLKAEVLAHHQLHDLRHAQREFDAWRHVYNHRRPHEALHMLTPSQRYRCSPRAYPATLPAIEYAPGDWVRKVDAEGWLSFKGHDIRVSKALHGYRVALRASERAEQAWNLYFCSTKIGYVDLADLVRN